MWEGVNNENTWLKSRISSSAWGDGSLWMIISFATAYVWTSAREPAATQLIRTYQGRMQKKNSNGVRWNEAPAGAPISIRWRRRGGGVGEPTRRSGGASWALSAGSGAGSGPQAPFQNFLSVTERFRWKVNAILLLNMITISTTATAEICGNSVQNFWGEHFWGLIP